MGKTIRPLESFGGGGPAAGTAGATSVEDPSRNVPVRQKLIDEAFEEWKWVQKLNAKMGRVPLDKTKRREALWSKNEWHHGRLVRAFMQMTPAEQAAYHERTGTPPTTPIGSEPAGE